MIILAENQGAQVKSADDSKIFAALSYLWVLSIVFYVLKKDDAYVQFHARQGMVLFLLSLCWIVPIIGWIVSFVAFIGIVVGAIKAYSGEKYRIPMVADLAEKINF